MVRIQRHATTRRTQEADDLVLALGDLSSPDRHLVGRLTRRLAVVEAARGEEVALAMAEQMEMIVRGRVAA